MTDHLREEELRINAAYQKRDNLGKHSSYAWHKLDVAYISYRMRTSWACALKKAGFDDLTMVDMLDVGCGSGVWLRIMVEWGADPKRLHGVDILNDRITKAKSISASGIDFQVSNSWPLPYAKRSMDLVVASTIFSSILDRMAREQLANEMKRVLRKSGWLMIFDFAISDPRNSDTIGVDGREINKLFSGLSLVKTYRLILAPPVLRLFPASFFWMCHFFETVLPFLCTHRLYMLQSF